QGVVLHVGVKLPLPFFEEPEIGVLLVIAAKIGVRNRLQGGFGRKELHLPAGKGLAHDRDERRMVWGIAGEVAKKAVVADGQAAKQGGIPEVPRARLTLSAV